MKNSIQESPEPSRVGERLRWLVGKTVTVRLRYTDSIQPGGEPFTAVYEDCLPVGRSYFFLFDEKGKKRIVQTEHVVEMLEA